MIVYCQYEVGLLDTFKMKLKGIGWLQYMLSVWGRMPRGVVLIFYDEHPKS